MKTRKLFTVIAPAALALSLLLTASVPAYAITSVAASDEQPTGTGDTFDESAPEPAYADEVVNGIINAPTAGQTIVNVTQEAPAATEEVVPVVETAPLVEEQVSPAEAAVPAVEPVAYAPVAQPAQTAPASTKSAKTEALPQEVTSEQTQETGQVLGVSTEKGADDALYTDSLIAGNKSLLDSVIANQSVFRNFFSTELLLLSIILPLLAVILFLQSKTLARTKTVVRAVKKK